MGFTLIETSIALLMMMVIFIGVASLFVYVIKYNSAAAIRAGALAAAQRKLEQLRADPFPSCVTTTETITVGNPGTVSHTYTVTTTVQDASSTMKNIEIVVTPQGRSTAGGVYGGPEGWMRGQVIIYAKRVAQGTGPNLG